jgi:hypothetical protein
MKNFGIVAPVRNSIGHLHCRIGKLTTLHQSLVVTRRVALRVMPPTVSHRTPSASDITSRINRDSLPQHRRDTAASPKGSEACGQRHRDRIAVRLFPAEPTKFLHPSRVHGAGAETGAAGCAHIANQRPAVLAAPSVIRALPIVWGPTWEITRGRTLAGAGIVRVGHAEGSHISLDRPRLRRPDNQKKAKGRSYQIKESQHKIMPL